MKTVAVYSLKGGVGKTTLAVNLAWASATLSSRRTLLWDLDPQAAAGFLLGCEQPRGREARAVFSRDIAPSKLVRRTGIERLSVLPADASLRELDRFFFDLGKKKRLEKLLALLGAEFDRVVLDCPPGLTETSEQILRAADVVLVPVIPSPLSRRALDDVVGHLDRKRLGRGAILPVYNMADRRRRIHAAALEANPAWPIVPMASLFEQMSATRRPVGEVARRSPGAKAVAELWARIEKRLAEDADRAARAAPQAGPMPSPLK
ncbi:ParA family protein [Sphingosinicella sp. CPCC 101087]|uniref:ParA family protein n=1 Tax=Sphingosinicella sp. CPCC 101087 TaxID=2497754 RepID=UPI00101C367F|nr:ParA family protein [Sphingosinicella sp. CPCC 101087]